MYNYQEALNRLKSINLDIIEDDELKIKQSDYGIHDFANFEMYGDLKALQELIDKSNKDFKSNNYEYFKQIIIYLKNRLNHYEIAVTNKEICEVDYYGYYGAIEELKYLIEKLEELIK